MRTHLWVFLAVLLLVVPGASAKPLVPDEDPISKPREAKSLDDHVEVVRETLKSLFPERAPFSPHCISKDTETEDPQLDRPADGDVSADDDSVRVYILVYDTLVRITIDGECLDD